MSLGSFGIALSGLSAAQSNLNATANNIANANTVGFKESSAEFGDIYQSSLYGASGTQSGSGVGRPSRRPTQTATTWPSQCRVPSAAMMRWPITTLLVPSFSVNSSTKTLAGYSIGRLKFRVAEATTGAASSVIQGSPIVSNHSMRACSRKVR